jgi:hypothetical protein
VTTKLKKLRPGKKIGIIVPQNQSASNLKQHVDFFKKSLLPQQVTWSGKIITARRDGCLKHTKSGKFVVK